MNETSRGDVVVAYLRSAWIAVGIGVIWAIVEGSIVAVIAGAIVGVLNLTGALVRSGRRAAVARVAVAAIAVMVPAALLGLVDGSPGSLAIVVGCAALMSLPASVVAEIRLARARPVTAGTPFDGPGIAAILIGGVVATIGSGASVALLRDGLHYGCSFALTGEGAGWTCLDGLGYIGAAAGLLSWGGLALAVGLTIAVSRRPRPWQGAALAALSFVPPIGAATQMLAGVTGPSQTFPPGADGSDGWIALVLPSLVVATIGLALAAAKARWRGPRGPVFFAIGIVAVVAAIALQVGMLSACVPAIALALAARARFVYVGVVRDVNDRAELFAAGVERGARPTASRAGVARQDR